VTNNFSVPSYNKLYVILYTQKGVSFVSCLRHLNPHHSEVYGSTGLQQPHQLIRASHDDSLLHLYVSLDSIPSPYVQCHAAHTCSVSRVSIPRECKRFTCSAKRPDRLSVPPSPTSNRYRVSCLNYYHNPTFHCLINFVYSEWGLPYAVINLLKPSGNFTCHQV
jgi:hypothetical protein